MLILTVIFVVGCQKISIAFSDISSVEITKEYNYLYSQNQILILGNQLELDENLVYQYLEEYEQVFIYNFRQIEFSQITMISAAIYSNCEYLKIDILDLKTNNFEVFKVAVLEFFFEKMSVYNVEPLTVANDGLMLVSKCSIKAVFFPYSKIEFKTKIYKDSNNEYTANITTEFIPGIQLKYQGHDCFGDWLNRTGRVKLGIYRDLATEGANLVDYYNSEYNLEHGKDEISSLVGMKVLKSSGKVQEEFRIGVNLFMQVSNGRWWIFNRTHSREVNYAFYIV